MITGLPLQNKLRTYRKRREKTTPELFLVSRAWTPPPPPSTAKPDEKFLDPRGDIRYCGGI